MAQPAPRPPSPPPGMSWAELFQDDSLAEAQMQVMAFENETMINTLRSQWAGRTVNQKVAEFLKYPDVREAWSISDVQWQQCKDHMKNTYQDMFERALPFDLESTTLIYPPLIDAVADILDEILTPQQLQKIKESQLVSMGELPLIPTSIFEALDLTDTQRQEMEKIKKELESKFEAVLDEFENSIMMSQGTAKKDVERYKLYKKKQEELMSKGKEFSTNFKMQMFDVLSDEQWKRLQRLIDNPPEHAKIFRAKLKEQNGESEAVAIEKPETAEKEVWQPGPNSWKPGDAIPEAYRQQRNERGKFPRVEMKESEARSQETE